MLNSRCLLLWIGFLLVIPRLTFPRSTEYFTVPEEQPAGYFVGKITTKANFTYRFSDTNEEHFRIEPTTGRIFTKRKIDRETLASQDFVLLVLSSLPIYPIEVKITVQDINDNAPSFPKQVFDISIPESDSVGTLYPLVGADDSDIGLNGKLSYQLIKGNKEGRFALEVVENPFGGSSFLQLNLTNALDRETVSSYHLTLQATDKGAQPLSGSCVLNITILDINDEYPLFNPSTLKASIYENITIGTVVAILNSTDRDLGLNGKIHYSIAPNDKDLSHLSFSIDRDAGILRSARKLDREGQEKYTLTIIARDNGVPPLEGVAKVYIELLDINDNSPTLQSNIQQPVLLKENSGLHTTVTFLAFEDRDTGDVNKRIALQELSGNEDNTFLFRSFPGRENFLTVFVLLGKPLDREKRDSYNLTFSVFDNGRPKLSALFSIVVQIEDINDCVPKFTSPVYKVNLVENIPRFSLVAIIKASDCDIGNNGLVKYSISSGNYSKWFAIDSSTGLITSNTEKLDRESLASDFFDLEILAKDEGSPSLESKANLSISVLDVNDNAPIFARKSYILDVGEDTAVGEELLRLQSRDSDAGQNGSVTYEAVSGDPEVKKYFQVDQLSGEVKLKFALDFETKRLHQFQAKACDNGEPKLCSHATVIINVQDINDNSPIFHADNYYAVISTAQVYGFVVQVSAYDLDSGRFGTVAYSIISGNDRGIFHQNYSSGEIFCQKVPSSNTRYHLKIQAKDGGNRQAFSHSNVFVYVTSNFAHVHFLRDHYSLQVLENSPSGQYIGKVSLDTPLGIQVPTEYGIIHKGKGKYVNIDQNGVLTTISVVNREEVSNFSFIVQAKTNESVPRLGQTEVLVTVLDENDNAPELLMEKFNFQVSENAEPDTEVLILKGSDADIGNNANLSYSLIRGGLGYFVLNSLTGAVKLAKKLQGSRLTSFALEIQCSDGGKPRQHSVFQLTIDVLDVNDNKPQFSAKEYSVWINQGIPINTGILKLNVSDSDRGNNGFVSLQISVGNEKGFFGLFPDGQLYLKQALTNAPTLFFFLVIKAEDHGMPALSSSSKVYIHVNVTERGVTIFKNKTYKFAVVENIALNSIVGKVAHYFEEGRGKILFQFRTIQPWLGINSEGVVITTQVLDREEVVIHTGSATVSVELEAWYTEVESVKDVCTVLLSIEDLNDNGPRFLYSTCNMEVSEDTNVGTMLYTMQTVDPDLGQNAVTIYKLVGDDKALKDFSLDPHSGVLVVHRKLDRENIAWYNMTVSASDAKNPSFSVNMTCHVIVLDVNDNTPQLDQKLKLISISEDHRVGDVVASFSAVDKDSGINGQLQYSIQGGNGSEVLHMNVNNGNLVLVKELDYETNAFYSLVVQVYDLGMPKNAAQISVDVVILDANDHAPMFLDPIQFFVVENTKSNTVVGQCQTRDKDSGLNGQVTYSLLEEDVNQGLFSLTKHSCILSINFTPDREKQSIYRLTIVAEDMAEDPKKRLSTKKVMTVLVNDQNDNRPQFVSHNTGVLHPSMGKGDTVVTVKAIDMDAGGNGSVTYRLTGTNAGLFQLDSHTGNVKLVSSSSSLPSVWYNLTITASDQGIPVLSVLGYLVLFKYGGQSNVLDFRKSNYKANLEENLIGTTVIRVEAYFSKGSGTIKYLIVSGDVEYAFRLDEDSGIIYAAKRLDHEGKTRNYNLVVYAVDVHGSLPQTASCTVSIDITDSNDNAPEFEDKQLTASVYENATTGFAFYKAVATDKDAGQNAELSYAIISGNKDGVFWMDQDGLLKTSKALDREARDLYVLTVQVTDRGTPALSSHATLVVHVLDINDNPPSFGISFLSFTILEGFSGQQQFGVVRATDPDLGRNGQLQYAITKGNLNIFGIDRTTGSLYVRREVDREEEENYLLRVTALDHGSPQLLDTITIYISVLDINDNAPVFDVDVFHGHIEENVNEHKIIVTVAAVDRDAGSNGLISYSILSGSDNGTFQMAGNGSVVALKPLDRERSDTYTLKIKAEDQAAPEILRKMAFATVIISIEDVNDNRPSFPNGSLNVSTSEGLDVGAVAHVLKAKDADRGINAVISYAIRGGNSAETFKLESQGSLILMKPLDFETQRKYTLLVEARDSGTPSLHALANLTINVLDENDHYPIIQDHASLHFVMENVTHGYSIITILATDSDSGKNAELTYSIVRGNALGHFSIDSLTGRIFTASLLDRETVENYTLNVLVSDNGNPTRKTPTTLNIRLVDINDCYPSFVSSNYSATVVENNSQKMEILQVKATDCDSGENGRVFYSLLDSFGGVFSVDVSSGILYVLKALDREKTEQFYLTVKAADNGVPSLSAETKVKVLVEDVNDNAPIFLNANLTAHVQENVKAGVVVTKVNATDRDIGQNGQVTFSLEFDFGRFQINSDTGVLFTSGGLDREEKENYTIQVHASDLGSPRRQSTGTIVIIIDDVNDSGPKFEKKRYVAQIPINSSAGTFIMRLDVSDPDGTMFSNHFFSLVSGNTSLVQVDSDSGTLVTTSSVPSDTSLVVVVKAADRDLPKLADTATIIVTTSSGFPVFSHGVQVVSILESAAPGSELLRVNASSPQVGPAGQIRFFVAEHTDVKFTSAEQASKVFDVESYTGRILVKNWLDYEKMPRYSLWIEARDAQNPPLSAFVRILISVVNLNDSAPACGSGRKVVSVVENGPLGQEITRIQCTDPDNPGRRDRIRFTVERKASTAWDTFSVDALSGSVRTRTALDREKAASHVLEISAFMVDDFNLKSSIKITVLVGDRNDNPPRILGPDQVSVSEDTLGNSSIAVFQGQDPDLSDSLVWSLNHPQFAIQSNSGRVYVIAGLDREIAASHSLLVTLSDGVHKVNHNLKVQVVDVNDFPPTCAQPVIILTVSESTLPLTEIGKVSFEDKDTAENAMSRFLLYDKGVLTKFSVKPLSGSLVLEKSLVYAKGNTKVNEYNFTVTIQNLRPPFLEGTCSVFLQVVDANDHRPVFSQELYDVYVSALSSPGSILMTVEAVDDKDSGENAEVRYRSSGGNGTSVVEVTSAGQIVVRSSVKGEEGKTFSLFVTSYDLGHPEQSATATVFVIVEPANRYRPKFETPKIVKTIPETFPLWQEIATVKATDGDNGIAGRVVYQVLGADSSLFAIGTENGTLVAVKSLDYEVQTKYELVVEARDSARHLSFSTKMTVEIFLVEINDNVPIFESMMYRGQIRENAPKGTSVIRVVATDRDSASVSLIRYSLTGSDAAYYRIDQRNGLITSTAVFDYEKRQMYAILVVAEDSGSPPLQGTTTVYVDIQGENEFAPKFTRKSYHFFAYDNYVKGTVVGQLQAEDGDSGADGLFLFIVTYGNDTNGMFEVVRSTGQVRTAKVPKIGVVKLEVLVRNVNTQGILPSNTDLANVTISVLDGNDPPRFNTRQYFVNVSEAEKVGTNILQVKAVDPDGNPPLKLNYGIVDGDIGDNFLMDPSAGWLGLKKHLDRETLSIVNLTISACDNGIPVACGNATVNIVVLDANDSPPTIHNCSGSVYENATNGTEVVHLSIYDADLEQNRAAVMLTLLTANIPFAINITAQTLYVSGALDREFRDAYTVRIAVRELVDPPLVSIGTCLINILDVSDVKARPRNVVVVINLIAKSFVGGYLGDLSPIDPDLNDQYQCALTSPSILFEFSNKSCRLEGSPWRGPSSICLNYSSTGGDSSDVRSSVFLQYNVINVTSGNFSLTTKLHGVEPLVFIGQKYTKFASVLGLGPGNKYSIAGILSSSPNTTDLYFALNQESGTTRHNNSNSLAEYLAGRKTEVKTLAGAEDVEIGIDICQTRKPCKNGGQCTPLTIVMPATNILSTDKVIFHSLHYEQRYHCQCLVGFVGTDCGEAIQSCDQLRCLNGGKCVSTSAKFHCACLKPFSGRFCENDVDECAAKPCLNGGQCLNSFGSFSCQCQNSFFGTLCEKKKDQCNPNPCLQSGTCTKLDSDDFRCNCRFGTSGRICEHQGMSFRNPSFLILGLPSEQSLNITMEISTVLSNALLAYAYKSGVDSIQANFISVEIVAGSVRLSSRQGSTLTRVTGTGVLRLDGSLETISAVFKSQVLVLVVNGETTTAATNDISTNFDYNGASLFIGGVISARNITVPRAPLDSTGFDGCMQNLYVNSVRRNLSHAVSTSRVESGCIRQRHCGTKPCGKLGTCTDLWYTFLCHCEHGITGERCNEVAVPYTLGHSARLEIRMSPAYQRLAELRETQGMTSTRRRRDASPEVLPTAAMSVKFRTRQTNALLMLAKDVGGNFTAVQIRDGKVRYSFSLGTGGSAVSVASQPMVSDGRWHNLSLTVYSRRVVMTIDELLSGSSSFAIPTHDFLSHKLDVLTFGGRKDSSSLLGEPSLDFQGCIDGFALDFENLSLSGSSTRYVVSAQGRIGRGCEGSSVCVPDPCTSRNLYCVDEWESFRCAPPGQCASSPCANGGKCIPTEIGYNCECLTNFTGFNCLVPLQCLLRPCDNSQRCIAGNSGYECVAQALKAENSQLASGIIVALVIAATLIFAICVGYAGGTRKRELWKMNAGMEHRKPADFYYNQYHEKYGEKDRVVSMTDAQSNNYPRNEADGGLIVVNEFTNTKRSTRDQMEVRDEIRTFAQGQENRDLSPGRRREQLRHEMRLLSKDYAKEASRSQPLVNGYAKNREGDAQLSKLSLPLRLSQVHKDARLSLAETRLVDPDVSVRYPGTSFEDYENTAAREYPNTAHAPSCLDKERSNLVRTLGFDALDAVDHDNDDDVMFSSERQKMRSADLYPTPLGYQASKNAKSLPANLSRLRSRATDRQGSELREHEFDGHLPYMESGFESTGSDTNYSDDQETYRGGRFVDDSSSQLEHYDLEVASMGFSEMSWQYDSSIDMRENTMNEADPRFVLRSPAHFLDYVSRSSNDRGLIDLDDRFSDPEPPESSTDSDDSFTCSELEIGEDRLNRQRRKKQAIFSRLADFAGSDAAKTQTMEFLSLPRGRHRWMMTDTTSDTSLSHGFTSSSTDFLPSSNFLHTSMRARMKRYRAPPKGFTGGPKLDWDELLNWAMKYENVRDTYNSLGLLKLDRSALDLIDVGNVQTRERQPRPTRHLELPFPSIRLADVPESEVEEYV